MVGRAVSRHLAVRVTARGSVLCWARPRILILCLFCADMVVLYLLVAGKAALGLDGPDLSGHTSRARWQSCRASETVDLSILSVLAFRDVLLCQVAVGVRQKWK